MKTNCPYCDAKKCPESGIWDFFLCGTDVDKNNKSRQSYNCLSIQRDKLLEKIYLLEDELISVKKA